MSKIKKPSPPEHIVIVDTNVLWHKDKGYVVNPDFDSFWDKHSETFPMKLILPEVVEGELLFQQTTSALKLLEKANQEISEISRITAKKYSHQVKHERIRKEIDARFSVWLTSRKAEVKSTPIQEIDWNNVIQLAIWRKPPFIADPENQKNEKGFRDAMILETVASVCRFYSSEVNIAFICNDFALRKAADERLGKIESFSTYESLKDFESFIELTKKNLTERFVKSILSRAKEKFHEEKDRDCLIYKDNFFQRIRNEFSSKIESPISEGLLSYSLLGQPEVSWKHIGEEQAWVTKPQFERLEGEHTYHWLSKITIVRLYERERMFLTGLQAITERMTERKLLILTIDVSWKSNVRADGRFFDCEIVEHKQGNYSFKEPTVEELERYGIQKNVEQVAQGEVENRPT